jgi:uncharacterized protein YbgA (DUF1722 family)/uncharacterized protein YbbK (DUF523 family)
MISDEFVCRLTDHVDFVTVCPEMEVGLGCPRDPIRVVMISKQPRLMQPATGKDVSDTMREFAGRFLDGLGPAEGFILKGRSPSCGIKDIKIYGGPEHNMPQGVGRGFFGGAVLDRLPEAAVEDEGRLTNFLLREHFLTKLFALAAFRQVARTPEMNNLITFHAAHKYLLMAYHQTELRVLGRIVANHDHRPVAEVFAEYGEHLAKALARPPRYTSMINVLMHALGYVSEGLGSAEKAFFLETLGKYRAGQVPLSVATMLLRSWAIRFNVPYLLEQTFLAPYPEVLVQITDSGKGIGR